MGRWRYLEQGWSNRSFSHLLITCFCWCLDSTVRLFPGCRGVALALFLVGCCIPDSDDKFTDYFTLLKWVVSFDNIWKFLFEWFLYILLPWKKISLENWKQFLLKLISTYFTSSWACSTDRIKNSKAKTPPSLLHTWHKYRLSMSEPAQALQVARLGTGLKLAIDSIPNCSPASFLSGGKTWSF